MKDTRVIFFPLKRKKLSIQPNLTFNYYNYALGYEFFCGVSVTLLSLA